MRPLPANQARATGDQCSYGLDDFRADRDAGIDHLIIARFKGVLDALADASKRVGEAARCHIAGQIEVHQPVNGFVCTSGSLSWVARISGSRLY